MTLQNNIIASKKIVMLELDRTSCFQPKVSDNLSFLFVLFTQNYYWLFD